MAYVAGINENVIATARTYNGAQKKLMEYRGFTAKEIRQMVKDGTDITVIDLECWSEQTIM